MAIAGKVAITLSTENGGAWSADVTYDRLVAVKHNNNLYISRKTVANVEPPNDEFWFLALEGFGGDDVQALIDRMNELSGLIQAIIDGTTQVGNAKTLDGHEAEYFAKDADLAKYLPLDGGGMVSADNTTPLRLKNNVGNNLYLQYLGADGNLGFFGFVGKDRPVFVGSDTATVRDLLHTGNKPTGTYTGNGDATRRTISTSGIGKAMCIRNNDNYSFVVVYSNGYFGKDKNGNFVSGSSDCFTGTRSLILATDSELLNASGVQYTYEYL